MAKQLTLQDAEKIMAAVASADSTEAVYFGPNEDDSRYVVTVCSCCNEFSLYERGGLKASPSVDDKLLATPINAQELYDAVTKAEQDRKNKIQ